MRGSFKKRYNNSWTWRIDLGIDPITGKRRQKTYSIKGTRKEAEKQAAEILAKLDGSEQINTSKISVADYLSLWLQTYAEVNLAPRTIEGYESIIRYHITPALGHLRLEKLTVSHLQVYYANMLNAVSAQTVKHHHTLIHKALETAVEWNLISKNVADRAKPPRITKDEMQVWNEIEMNAFLDASKETPWYALFYTALFTGMRRSELLALRWQDIDFILSNIYVNRSMHQLTNRDIIFRNPKTAKGKRSVSMSPSLYLVLKDTYDAMETAMLLKGKKITGSDPVFCNDEWKPLLPSSVSHAWTRICKQAGVKPIRLHDARHTHASLLLKQGVHPKIVQERLGHSSIQITLDTYSHVAPGLQDAAARQFDELLKKQNVSDL